MNKRFVIWAGLVLCPGCARAPGEGRIGPAGMEEGRMLEVSRTTRENPLAGMGTVTGQDTGGREPEYLEELVEVERAGGFVRGMGFMESGIRERAGDFCGAVIAVFKELSWAWNYGGLPEEGIERGMNGVVLGLQGQGEGRDRAARTAKGVLAFHRGDWADARRLLEETPPREDEPDSFYRWMLLVCRMEEGDLSKQEKSSYGAIRARFRLFPEYWYRGARAFSGFIAGEYAENCINLYPQGPFAPECREIIAKGLGPDFPGEAIRSKAEMDDLINKAVSHSNPELLGDLFPLISLPDNNYTMYALGILKSLAGRPEFRTFFESQAAASRGRLAERLNYIIGGAG